MITSVDDLRDICTGRLKQRWAAELITGDAWPLIISTKPRGALRNPDELTQLRRRSAALKLLTNSEGIELAWAEQTSKLPGQLAIKQPVPTLVSFSNIDVVASFVGQPWPQRIAAGRRLSTALNLTESPELAVKVLNQTKDWPEVDREMLIACVEYFGLHGQQPDLTSRQIPVPGVHTKWLERHSKLVASLSGLDDLGFKPKHTMIEFTYLDPDHRSAGKRLHDTVTLGDAALPLYTPTTVILCENKDCARHFGEVPGAIAVFCSGDAAVRAARVEWIVNAPLLLYWGDLDADGFEIVASLRRLGMKFSMIGMDIETIHQYARLGTNWDKRGNPLIRRDAKPMPELSKAERAAYELLCDPNYQGYRRIEQERMDMSQLVQLVQTLQQTRPLPGLPS